ncbi:uridine diphosphate-N-acetylglucosamine-binding protein YvcK [Candidatus Uhrbacteria bacterium]|nr:uridine diphosphate-N-acetylglucosamine-binding protein YvcK [Candidatus Uhrbacteria bacterium]
MNTRDKQRPKIVVLGGGTGTFTVLTGLKKYDVNLSAVVSIADDGGSTGRLRDEMGVLPPGDIRQCLAALAEGDNALRHLLNFRFTKGELSGHNFGNLFISALEQMYGSAESGIKMAHKILRVAGRVIPVSARASTLYAELDDRSIVEGEHAIDMPGGDRAPILRCFLDPPVMANPDAVEAVRQADLLVMGPGDLHTSLVPVLLVEGVAEALAAAGGKKVFVMNLVAKPGQTQGYTAQSFLEKLDVYLRPATLDAVVINTAPVPKPVLERYMQAGEHVIEDDLGEPGNPRVAREDVLSDTIARPKPGDMLKRSLLRHDPDKLARVLLDLA